MPNLREDVPEFWKDRPDEWWKHVASCSSCVLFWINPLGTETNTYRFVDEDRIPKDAAFVRASWIEDNPDQYEVLIDLFEGQPWWQDGAEWTMYDAPFSPGTWVAARLKEDHG